MRTRRRAPTPPSERELRHADRRAEARRREQAERLSRAAKDWKQLGADAQFDLVCEIIETRSDELKRAYAGVLGIAAGHSRYRRAGATHKTVWREPAVTFLVRRKWRSGSAKAAGTIPGRLLAYASVDGRRTLCAVPTDVEDARDYRLSAQASSGIIVTPPPSMSDLDESKGAITCVLRTSPTSPTQYVLGCRHVLGLAESLPPEYPRDAGVFRESGNEPIEPLVASVSDIYGLLHAGTEDNFDVALARLRLPADDPAVRTLVERLGSSDGQRYVDGHKAIKELGTYTILTPRGEKTATYVRGWAPSEQPLVTYGSFGSLRQGVLIIESHLTGTATAPGDSGSPIVTKDRSRLVGMHFAGVNRTSYMIPAYELVNRGNYVGFAAGAPFVID